MKIKIDLGLAQIAKMFLNGKIDQVYSKMYKIAEGLAMHETDLYMGKLIGGKELTLTKETISIWDKVFEKREARLAHHMQEMKELLVLYLKQKED